MKSYWTPVLLASFILLLMVMIYVYQPKTIEPQKSVFTVSELRQDSLQNEIADFFSNQKLKYTFYQRQSKRLPAFQVDVPRDMAIPMLHYQLQDVICRMNVSVIEAPSNPLTKDLDLYIGWRDSVFLKIAMHRVNTKLDSGKIALLIDDFGDRWDSSIESFCYLGGKISISVLPGRPQSRRVAKEMRQRGCDVLLHLPMQPKTSSYKKMDFMITTDLNQSEIQNLVYKALQDVPGVVGMNNHMGSRVTENHKMMRYILEVIQAHDLYFIDSRTTSKSVAFHVARELNMPCAKKDVFIDNSSNKAEIRKWMNTLAGIARKKGSAIGIGHCHQYTLDVLREMVPELQAKGFRFVTLSEIVQ